MITNLLVIDSNDSNIALLTDAITRGGFKLRVERDHHWSQTIDRFGSKSAPAPDIFPQIILMSLDADSEDWRLGIEVIKKTASLRRVPLIVGSSTYNSVVAVDAYQRYANCFVIRPNSVEDVIHFLEKMISFWKDTARLAHDDRSTAAFPI